MRSPRTTWQRWLVGSLLFTAGVGLLLPAEAEAQIFGGRLRARIRGVDTYAERDRERERVRNEGPVVVEPNYREFRLVVPRGRADYDYGAEDYGPGFDIESQAELRRERRVLRDTDDVRDRDAYAADRDRRELRSSERQRSVLRAPADSRDLADAEYRDTDREIRRFSSSRPVRSNSADRGRITPPEDPYERETADDRDYSRSRITSRERNALDDRRDYDSRDDQRPVRPASAELEDREPSDLPEEELLLDPPTNQRPATVDSAPAEQKPSEDDFDKPRSKRDTEATEVEEVPKTTEPVEALEPDSELLPPPPPTP